MNFRASLLSVTCLGLVACGGGGGSSLPGGGSAIDTTAPTVTFSPTTLTVEGGSTGTSTLTATDNVGVLGNPSVTCTNGGSFSNNTFTAPDVSTETTSVCTATAQDVARNTGSATLTVTITVAPDTEAPSISFEPPTLTVASGGTGTSTLTAIDNRDTPNVSVSCTNGGSFDGSTFTAPDVTVETTSVCTASASDNSGNDSSATLTVTVNPPDTTAPSVTLPTANLTVESGQSASYIITVSDNSGETIVPTVTCDNGGSWVNNEFTAPTTETDVTVTCTVTATDSGNNTTTDTFTVQVTGDPTPNSVTLSGKIQFDLVPLNTTTNGLDYANTVISPARGVTVQAVDASNAVLETTRTNASGDYTLEAPINTDVRIRALAEMVSTTGPQWDVKVIDNTSNGDLYVLQGSLTNTGENNANRTLTADSGWGGSSYTSARQAGPFAILNPIYDSLQKMAAADPDIVMPLVNFNWSVNNTATNSGDNASGAIGTSFYTNGNIFILGDDDDDTDEYDDHVVVHEWGHYFEDRLSRSDSIGGPHGGGDRLDPRVAFGEGFGNALSGMMTDDPVYRDSNRAQQAQGFSIDVESNAHSNEGWFNEGSVQSILYDIYDSNSDGTDNVSAGFAPIYNTLVSESYKTTPYLTTIFHFAEQYKTMNSGDTAGLDALLAEQSINGSGPTGSGETNSGSISGALPVYKQVSVGGASVEVCSNAVAGTYNKLGNRAYIEVTPSASGTHTVTMSRVSGATSRDPDFDIYNQGITSTAFSSRGGAVDSETWSGTLTAGTTYIIDAYDATNVFQGQTSPSGAACYNVTVTN